MNIDLTKEEIETLSSLLKEAYVAGKINSMVYGPIENKLHRATEAEQELAGLQQRLLKRHEA